MGSCIKSSLLFIFRWVTQTITPWRGNPQSGILSPLVWNLVMDSLLKEFPSGPVKAVGYADDIIIMASGIDMRIGAENIQLALNKIINWGKAKGLVFNPSKTQAIIFDRSQKYKVSPRSILMDGQELEFTDRIKYLGMTIQSRLSWTAHVVGQIKKANMLLSRARTIVGREWGLNPEKALWIYRICPCIIRTFFGQNEHVKLGVRIIQGVLYLVKQRKIWSEIWGCVVYMGA